MLINLVHCSSIGLSKFVKGSCEIQKMTAYERARDEQVEKNLAMLESLGIKDLIASLPALYWSSQRKGTKKRKSKVAIGNDEEFLPPVCKESFGYSSDDSSGSQADKVKCTTRRKKKGGSGNRILRDSQGTREERHIIEGATLTPPTQPSTDHVEGMSVVAAQPTQLPCIATNNEVGSPKLTAAAVSYGFCSAAAALCSPALLSASFLSRKCNPVVERRAEELTEEVISQRSTIDSLTVKTNRLQSLYEKLASRMDMGSSPTSTLHYFFTLEDF
ncbi:hypothetical protein RHMOL_Rhmol04G0288600 [Rhododendron molle]|uniref:Uncharacterized protein n=1 Tax=Rhododendron molle TaxID=49168 RepID=A0ACC0P825_RHOML|nr:hypothetical protein RHMOL_Rhmol04G0288600 [Rhododendron molle]